MRPTISLKETDKGWKALVQSLSVLKHGDSYARAGVIGKQAEAAHEGGLTNGELALIHEFGTADGRIPSRSFMRAPFDANKSRYIEMLRKLLKAVYEGKATVPQVLGIVAMKMASDQQAAIRAGIPPPLKLKTIARKGSSKPLIDTGQLIRSITGGVVLKGGKE